MRGMCTVCGVRTQHYISWTYNGTKDYISCHSDACMQKLDVLKSLAGYHNEGELEVARSMVEEKCKCAACEVGKNGHP